MRRRIALRLMIPAVMLCFLALWSCAGDNEPSAFQIGDDIFGYFYVMPSASGTYDLCVRDGILFTANINGVLIIDVTNPSQATILGGAPFPIEEPCDIEVTGDVAYVCTKTDSITIVSVLDLYDLSLHSTFVIEGSASYDVEIDGDLLLASTGEYLEVFDITDPLKPVKVNKYPVTDHSNEGLGIYADEKLALVCKRNGTIDGTDIDLIDYSDASDLTFVSQIDLGPYEYAYDICMSDDGSPLAIASDEEIATLLDLNDPYFPLMLGDWEPGGTGGEDACICGGIAVYAQTYNGIRIADISDRNNIRTVARLDDDINVDVGSPCDVEPEGCYVYVAAVSKIIILEFLIK